MGQPKPACSAAWHAMPVEAVFAMLQTQLSGLASAEAERRLRDLGPNALPRPHRAGPLRRILSQFNSILIYILLAAGLITAFLGHLVDSAVIIGVVLINAAVGFVQEGKAEDALESIRNMLSLDATVLREEQPIEMPAERVVPGDLIMLTSGDKVPADLRIIQAQGLLIDEAVLTGESIAVEKKPGPVPEECELGDRFSMAYSGTLVTHGRGVGIVVTTGAATEIGRIGDVVSKLQEVPTPLFRKMSRFAQILTWSILCTSVILFAFGVVVRGYTAREMFMAVVGIAVAAIPEGLPAILTITLAIGVKRMARRNAIVRRLPAVEALGSVTVICTDKTGTLTRNEMTVQRLFTSDTDLRISGTGFDTGGEFIADGVSIDPTRSQRLLHILRAALLCNDATLRVEDGNWRVTGDPTEVALLTLAVKAGLELQFERKEFPRDDVIPFEAEHRFMATLHHDRHGRGYTFLKGAPERVFEVCTMQATTSGMVAFDAAGWHDRLELAATSGVRLLALAMRLEEGHTSELVFADVERGGFTLLGVLGLGDPPRDEAIRAVAACRSAGIRVKMITGDHPVTATAIGRQLALDEHIQTVRGTALDDMNDEEFQEAAVTSSVFARASPEHKLKLVKALQARGEVVAMTGDGVNDAPALKSADVGVAMGRKGTEAAKDSAQIVLTDDNFSTIAAAVEEGRTVYDNIRKALIFMLPTNGGEAGMVLVSILLGMTLPITPVQILWVNMVTAITLSLAIAFEKPEPDVMARPPRDPGQPLLSRFLVWRIVFVSSLMVAGGMGLFLWELKQGESMEAARTACVNALVVCEMTYLFSCRHLRDSWFSWEGVSGNRYILLAIAVLILFQLLFTYQPFMQNMFATAAIGAGAWVRVFLVGAVLAIIVETEKLFLRRKFSLEP